ncbi:MAG: ASPIC/UnbV domain-containing protein, partial [Planctomycetota bacterium]
MSQTPQSGEDAEDGYFAAWQAILRWTEEGRSWSGKEKHCCFLNVPGQAFADVSAVSGLDLPEDGRGVGLTDWDNDGDLDIWISSRSAPQLRFFRNDLRDQSTDNGERNFLALRLVGTRSNRDGVGARVSIISDETRDQKMVKSLRAGEGFLSQRSKWMHFGLGTTRKSLTAQVVWPDGQRQEFRALEVNRHYVLTQGAKQPREWSRPQKADGVQAESFVATPASSAAQHLLVARMPMPPVEYASRQNPRSKVLDGLSSPRLVVLWASWCKPCLDELGEFATNKSRLDKMGLDIRALSVDAAGGDDGTGARNA